MDLDDVKELAYLLYSIAEKKGWAETALLFNNLGTLWTDLEDTARKVGRPGRRKVRVSSRSSSGATTMATSNRERVDAGLQLLRAGLRPFVDAVMSATAPGRAGLGSCSTRGTTSEHGTTRSTRGEDPRFLLKVVTEEWRAVRDKLSRAEQSFASELRETGNKVAHGDGVQRR